MTHAHLEPLAGSADDVRTVQQVLDGAPGYAHRVTGQAPAPSAARDVFATLPPGTGQDAKHVYGVVVGGHVVGCLDLIRGWPQPATAHIGLLVLDEEHTGQGLGRAAFDAVEDLVRQWPEIDRLRATVVATNDVVLPFWRAAGLVETGETTPYQHGSITSRAIVLTKTLTPQAHPRRPWL